MTKRLLLSASAVLIAAIPAFAQGGPGGPGGPGPMGFGGDHGGPGMRTPVTNAPYTATFTSSSTEKLQDGTVLTHSSTRVAERDSLGRTREEITMPAHGSDGKAHTMIVIMDPVTRTITQLRTDQKIAVVHTMPAPPTGAAAGAGRRGPGGPPPEGQAAGADGKGPGRHQDKNAVTAELGAKTMYGVVATGKRVTRTIPAGEMGNTTPLVSTHEEWFATDLKIELSRNDVDPFHGTHTSAVSSLTKAEPDAALFKVPSDYTVQQAPQHAFGHRGPGAQQRDGGPPPPAPGV
jgi:hypothetical protein